MTTSKCIRRMSPVRVNSSCQSGHVIGRNLSITCPESDSLSPLLPPIVSAASRSASFGAAAALTSSLSAYYTIVSLFRIHHTTWHRELCCVQPPPQPPQSVGSALSPTHPAPRSRETFTPRPLARPRCRPTLVVANSLRLIMRAERCSSLMSAESDRR
jgi:hypothetical protein